MEKLYPLFKIAELITKEKSDGLSTSEKEILHIWISESESNKFLYKKLQNGEILVTGLNELKKFDSDKAFEKAEQRIAIKDKPFKFISFIPDYLRYAAAIAVLIVCSYFIINKFVEPKTQQYAQNTILPGKQRAILITAQNLQIVLDSSEKKQIIKDELANIINSGSTLSYSKNDSVEYTNGRTLYNTLITPRGGEYTLVLSDGTEVMLNADSKLTYPVVFDSTTRDVTLEGEAFFKVAKSGKIPFTVKANKVNVTVYGTTFNITAYRNESLIQTTLVEGSVGVTIDSTNETSVTKIKPGQQFTYNKSNGITETKEVNTEQYIAWTEGMFQFENEPIENILQVMSRWYDFNYEFKDNNLKQQRFTLSLGRYDNVGKILDLISVSSKVKFEATGNTVKVYSE